MKVKAKEEEEIKNAYSQVSGLRSCMEGSAIYWTGDNLGRNRCRGWVVFSVVFLCVCLFFYCWSYYRSSSPISSSLSSSKVLVLNMVTLRYLWNYQVEICRKQLSLWKCSSVGSELEIPIWEFSAFLKQWEWIKSLRESAEKEGVLYRTFFF